MPSTGVPRPRVEHKAGIDPGATQNYRSDKEALVTVKSSISRREAHSNGPIEGGTPSLRGMTPGSGVDPWSEDVPSSDGGQDHVRHMIARLLKE